MLLRIALVTLGVGAGALPLQAQDQCRDVLQRGTMSYERLRENSFFQQIVYSRFMRSDYNSSKTDRVAGFGIPIGEAVMGTSDYSEKDYDEKKRSIALTKFQQINAAHELDAMLISGDPVVVGAWSECMRERGGLSLRFEVLSPTVVQAKLTWQGRMGVTDATLTSDVDIPDGVTVDKSGRRCWKKGTKLAHDNSCVSTVRLATATTTFSPSINTNRTGVQGYVAPRLVLDHQRQAFLFSKADSLHTEAFRTTKNPSRTVTLSEQQMADGWTFDLASWKLRASRTGTDCWANGPASVWSKPTLTSISYGFDVVGHSRGTCRNSSGVGRLHPSVEIVRDYWMPMNEQSWQTVAADPDA